MDKEIQGTWLTADGVVKGLVIDDFVFDMDAIYANPALHKLYHNYMERYARDIKKDNER